MSFEYSFPEIHTPTDFAHTSAAYMLFRFLVIFKVQISSTKPLPKHFKMWVKPFRCALISALNLGSACVKMADLRVLRRSIRRLVLDVCRGGVRRHPHDSYLQRSHEVRRELFRGSLAFGGHGHVSCVSTHDLHVHVLRYHPPSFSQHPCHHHPSRVSSWCTRTLISYSLNL